MGTVAELETNRLELNAVIDDYRQSVADFNKGTITKSDLDTALVATLAKSAEYAHLTGRVKRDNPDIDVDALFTKPSIQNAAIRKIIADILWGPRLVKPGMYLTVDTEATTAGATNVALSFAAGSLTYIDWGDGTGRMTHNHGASHTYLYPGRYTIHVEGAVTGFSRAALANRKQIRKIRKWGNLEFSSMSHMFRDRTEFVITARDAPKMMAGCSTFYMFHNATDFNSPIDHWDVSNVTSMYYMFNGARAFNQSLNKWNVSNVTSMYHMFRGAVTYDQPMDQWDTSGVTSMYHMFNGASNFNQNISMWNVAAVTNYSMFSVASALTAANSPF